jgi:hypothetical protein
LVIVKILDGVPLDMCPCVVLISDVLMADKFELVADGEML